MVDVRAFETHDIGEEGMGGAKLGVGLGANQSPAMPAKRLQGLAHEFFRLHGVEVALPLEGLDELTGARRQNLSGGQDACSFRAQVLVLDQLQPQQRREYTKRI